MFDLKSLFTAARANPANPMNQPGRLMGKNCVARLQRAQAKRVKRGKRPYRPALGGQRDFTLRIVDAV